MDAIVLFDRGGKFGFRGDWPEPTVPEGWALVKTAYAGVCGSDIPRFSSQGSYHYPMVLGHEFSGVVERPGSSGRFCEGDRVAVLPIMPCGQCEGCRKYGAFHCDHYQFIGSRNDGGFADFCAVPETNLLKLPEGFPLRFGALLEPLLVGLHVVRRSGFCPGERAVVFGAGPIGLLIACWLKVFQGTRVAVADIRPFSLNIARQCGFEAVDISAGPDGLPEKVDHAFEASGANASIENAVRVLRRRGTFTVVGRNTRDTVIPLAAFETLMRKEIDLMGCWGYDPEGELEFVRQVMAKGKVPFEHLITKVVPASEGERLIRDIIERRLEYCKALIAFRGSEEEQ